MSPAKIKFGAEGVIISSTFGKILNFSKCKSLINWNLTIYNSTFRGSSIFAIIDLKSVSGSKITSYQLDESISVDIDTEENFKLAEIILKSNNELVAL